MTIFEREALAFIASRSSAGTQKLYTGDLGAWLEHCKCAKVNPQNPPMEAATTFRDMLQVKYAPLTVRRILAALSKMYRTAVAKRAATWNPFDGNALPRPPADEFARTEAVADDVAQRVIAAAEADVTNSGIRDAAILRLLYGTGIRRFEVAGLKRENVFMRDEQMLIFFIGKKGKSSESEVPSASALALNRWLKIAPGSMYVFTQMKSLNGNERPIDRASINKIIKRRAAEAGVGHVHPHQFRAAWITSGLDMFPLQEVRAGAHHSSSDTTLRYDRGKRGIGIAAAIEKRRLEKQGK